VFVNDDMLRDDHAWDQLDAVLGRFAAEFVAEGVPVTFVVLPDGRAMFPHDDERYDRVRTRVDRAMALCASHGLDCLDAWPAFEEAPPTGSWFMADGFHFASRGHRHFATWLRANLLEAE
jgi:lysophospholipase L1-like esterase